MQETLTDIAPLFEERESLLQIFGKDTYSDAFWKYYHENDRYFTELNRVLSEEPEESFFYDYAKAVIQYAAGEMEKAENRVKRESLQLDFNLFMTVYFLPALQEKKAEDTRKLAKCLCRKWEEAFAGNQIRNTDFATIMSGFRGEPADGYMSQ